jgi:sialate O-acetylesterase
MKAFHSPIMQLASLFHDHAVLQRNIPIPVWGTGLPGEHVTVRLAGLEAKTVVDPSGRWLLRLPPLKEGGPYTLTAESPSEVVEIKDVLVGEVWICSGQSNMEWTLNHIGASALVDLPSLPEVRMLTVTNPAQLGRSDTVDGKWQICSPESLATFSAVGGFFGRRLHEVLGVPIGLINNAWGGTRVQAWTSREALMQEPESRNEIQFYESYVYQPHDLEGMTSFESWERCQAPRATENLGLPEGWASQEFDHSSWETMALPGFWQSRGHGYSGVFWFRRSVEIPESWIGKELELSLGAIDKHDETWVNGHLVGATGRDVKNSWSTHRVYRVPGEAVNSSGSLIIAIRVHSHVYAGGVVGPAEMMWLAPVGGSSEDRIPLAGEWRYIVECNWGVVVPPTPMWGASNPNSPAILFDNRVAPLIPYGFRGVIWYQGESNVGEAGVYRRMLPAMINDWRRAWGAGNFPFIQVQLANYLGASKTPTESSWAALREAQASALALEASGMAVAIDIGEAEDIHPKNKRDVGLRLAQSALHDVYHQAEVPMGPLFSGMTIEAGGRIRCTFHHTGGKLVAKGGELRHFAIAGKDRVFHWAEATIEGNTVVVSSPLGLSPYAVRYAWADNPEGCNLYNRFDLPAAPFRSDAWPVV